MSMAARWLGMRASGGSGEGNLHPWERLASLLAAGGLFRYGLRRGGAPGLAALALGGFLALRGYPGECALYRMLGIDTRRARRLAGNSEWVELRRTVTVRCPPAQLYAAWRHLEELPALMPAVRSVVPIDGRRSRWTVRGPAGAPIRFESEIVRDRPGEQIAWRSIAGSDVEHEGAVEFRPTPEGGGTELSVSVAYRPPAGRIGRLAATLLRREPGQQIADGLARLKRRIESGAAGPAEG